MNNKLIFLGLIPVLMLTVPNVYASEDNCDENPNDSLCNGDRGIEGLIFCDVLYDALYHIPYITFRHLSTSGKCLCDSLSIEISGTGSRTGCSCHFKVYALGH